MEESDPARELKQGIRRATIANKLIPVAGGSAFKNKGVQYLLDAVIDYLPSPLDIPPAIGMDPDDEELQIRFADRRPRKVHRRSPSNSGRTSSSASSFSSASIPASSKRATPFTTRAPAARERVGRLIQIQANEHKDIDACYAGDIAAIVGLKNVTTGDTLRRRWPRCRARAALFPGAGHFDGRRAEDQGGPGKNGASPCSRLSEEDPTFIVKTNEETGQTIISGMGELHLEIIIDRIRREFKVEANTGEPQIAYRETITTAAKRRGQAGQAIRRTRPIRPCASFR